MRNSINKTIKSANGGIYLMALITLVVGLTLGLALLRKIDANVVQYGGVVEEGGAEHLADAGISYGYWLYRHCSDPLPIGPITLDLGIGETTLEVSEYDSDSVIIEAIGEINEATASKKRIIRKNVRVFDMALTINKTAYIPEDLITGNNGANGDIWVNGDFQIRRLLNASGDLTVSEQAWVWPGTVVNISGDYNRFAGCITFPEIDLEYYQTNADRIFTSNTDFSSGFAFLKPYELIYINGNVKMRHFISGTGVLVINGNLEIERDVLYSQPNTDKLAVIVTGNMTVKSSANTINGVYYAHNPSKSSRFKADSDLVVELGALIFDEFNDAKRLEVIADPAFRNSDLPNKLSLPGYEPLN